MFKFILFIYVYDPALRILYQFVLSFVHVVFTQLRFLDKFASIGFALLFASFNKSCVFVVSSVFLIEHDNPMTFGNRHINNI